MEGRYADAADIKAGNLGELLVVVGSKTLLDSWTGEGGNMEACVRG